MTTDYAAAGLALGELERVDARPFTFTTDHDDQPAQQPAPRLSDLAIPNPALVVLVGVSGAGKSTLAAAWWRPWQIVSLDVLRGELTGDPFNQDATGEAVRLLHLLTEARMTRLFLTVVDATNLTPDVRRPLLQAAQAHGIPAHAVVVAPPLETARARNAARPGPAAGAQWGERVPAPVADEQARLFTTWPPSTAEGFAAVHILGPSR